MNLLITDIWITNSVISNHLGNNNKCVICLYDLTNSYIDNTKFLYNNNVISTVSKNNLIFTNSLINYHIGNFINIETHLNNNYS